ncbi:acetyl-CoA carboxylase [Streptomyces agglomeratus]|uniref:Acetyl-coenzyme A carboxylase carboxyl transferase subunits beta/alpha n=1 Tax=Streptomyces agglomeratus TaxID=285458 RepID=A0A1E5P2R5_9ACTN|nr:carboxyl transferase domain-containing protein [Streptomyces agglomeratus]OEJ23853.1 acetyl-CoA carboxylase [Streptomyces agglomeratus]OEJ43450.1 acetyl-CoA carboxylase [Streptomyces agglomeratus]OEJ54630.1 acetyl-CoA carboxylase [Streptomyces agglomeratus]
MAENWTAREAIAAVVDRGSFTELPDDGGGPSARTGDSDGPIGWPGYGALLARAGERTGEGESVVCGTGSVGGTEAVVVSFEFGFLGGSLAERTGDRLEAAYTVARERRRPLVSLIATGGSRMQEGMRALVQLQRVARQSALLRSAGVPQLAVLRDPTTGGGWATLGAGADVILALPGAQVGFAGSRVRPPGADPAAYTAEGQWAAGQIDAVVRRDEVAGSLAGWLRHLTAAPWDGPPEPPGPPAPYANRPATPTGWEAVTRARSPERPRAGAYLAAYFDEVREISGDRCGGTDPGVRCGFGLRQGRVIAYAAQCGTATLPADFRTAARLVRLADRLGIPVLTLVDTPGAANDAAAERAGAGAAIADLFGAMATARVPLTTLLIGEGGSGGALALAAPGNLWAARDSYFSVIAPEAAAAILKRTPDRVPETAGQLRLRPEDLVELGIARGVVG